MNLRCLAIVMTLISANVWADDSTLDAAIGGGLGGATGAAIGNEVGGRDGAIVGGAIGAAVGTSITTDDDHKKPVHKYESVPVKSYHEHDSHPGRFCPPGQAKKGRC